MIDALVDMAIETMDMGELIQYATDRMIDDYKQDSLEDIKDDYETYIKPRLMEGN